VLIQVVGFARISQKNLFRSIGADPALMTGGIKKWKQVFPLVLRTSIFDFFTGPEFSETFQHPPAKIKNVLLLNVHSK